MHQNVPARSTGRPVGVRPYLGVIAAGVLLLAGGVSYRALAAYVGGELATPIRLDPPLATLPLVIGPWLGEDVPIREAVLRIAGNDDYVSRSYRHVETGAVVGLYIGYTARPRTMLRHRPSVCYPSAGWTPLSMEDGQLPLAVPAHCRPALAERSGAGGDLTTFSPDRVPSPTAPALPSGLPVRLHAFLSPGTPEQRVMVLNYYVLNGVPTIDEHSFWGLTWRDPNRGRDATRYVAQVQVTGMVRTTPEATARTLREFAGDSASAILPLLPEGAGPARPATGGAD